MSTAFELGGLAVPLTAALNVQQRVEVFGGRSALRFATGARLNQTAWQRLRFTLTGDGWVPPALDGLNPDVTHVFKAGLPLARWSADGVVSLPPERRTDAGYAPFARAHGPAGDVLTPVTVLGHVATCVPVAGATGYSVMFYPQHTVWMEPVVQSFDRAGAAVTWDLVLEQA